MAHTELRRGAARLVVLTVIVVCAQLQHGWKFSSLTRTRAPAAPADPYFSSNAKVAPGHFIDHDNGMDCQNTGGAEVCDPPNGTVHYFDPDQNLPCTRTGAMSVCSNL